MFLYSLTLVIVGIYLNQEYQEMFPSIKTIIINSMIYIKTLSNNDTNNTTVNNFSYLNKIYEFFIKK
jgi:hypothetical protein